MLKKFKHSPTKPKMQLHIINVFQTTFVQLQKNHLFLDIDDGVVNKIKDIYSALSRHADADKFYNTFYGRIVLITATYFHPLELPICTLVVVRLADKHLSSFTSNSNPSKTSKANFKKGIRCSSIFNWLYCPFCF